MKKKLEYTATNTGRPFSIKEMIAAANLKLEGYTDKEIKQKSMEENIFQARSEHYKNKIAKTVLMRLNTLDEYLINRMATSDIETAKQILIYSIMKSDRFFFEFMDEIYKDKIILRDYKINDSDINIFIQRKQEQIPQISEWTESTINKLKSQYTSMLYEAGFINRTKEHIEIIQPLIDYQLKNHLIEIGDEAYLKAMIGEL
ncbi:DUF1819 family protein [Romboutsia sp.]|uniref:DUF1819 family protein n=1 Tax=Romboutsia sp. TaxID=1965302 RepID=UPI003F38AD32